MVQPKLTGRKRFRLHKRMFQKPLLVLQLEVEGLVPHNDGGRIECELETWWIDAQIEHLPSCDIFE